MIEKGLPGDGWPFAYGVALASPLVSLLRGGRVDFPYRFRNIRHRLARR